jgi:hypothetical protein
MSSTVDDTLAKPSSLDGLVGSSREKSRRVGSGHVEEFAMSRREGWSNERFAHCSDWGREWLFYSIDDVLLYDGWVDLVDKVVVELHV